MKFSNTVETTASAEDIWRLWTDVEKWPAWDSELVSAQLEGAFALGAMGQLVPRRGAPSQFVISQLADSKQIEQRSYTFTVRLPLCKLHVRRFFSCPKDALYFTHEVSFEGITAPLFGLILGRQFRQILPQIMQSLKELAENKSLEPSR